MIKGIHFVRKRLADGRLRWYIYAWRGGPQIMTAVTRRKPKLTPASLETLARVRGASKQRPSKSPETIADLRDAWMLSPEWKAKAASTKKTWEGELRNISAKWGKVPLAVFDDMRTKQKVVAWRDSRRDTARGADTGIQVLRALLKYGIGLGKLQQNVASGIGQIYENGQRADIVWTDDDLAAFERKAGRADRSVYLAVLLCSVTGLRRADLIGLRWSEIGPYAIRRMAEKSSRKRRSLVTIPRVPALNAVLQQLEQVERLPGVDTVLVTHRGKPWHKDTLSREVGRIVREAGIVHVEQPHHGGPPVRTEKHLHDARGTFATYLMTTSDLVDTEIAEIMGWTLEQVVRNRRICVDDTARTVALARRIAGQSVNR